MTSLGSFTTRLRHNRIQNPTERIHLIEIYECETATSREKRILKNSVQLYRYSTEASRGSASQERNASLQTLLRFAFKPNSYDKTKKPHISFICFRNVAFQSARCVNMNAMEDKENE